MKTKVIEFKEVEDIEDFCAAAARVDGDVTLSRGAFSVDATSFLGVTSLVGICNPTTVNYPDDAIEFEEYLVSAYK